MHPTTRAATATAIVAVGLLAGCVVTHPWSTTPAGPLTPGEISRLDEQGRDRAEAIGHLRLDLSDLCLTTDETGFELDNPTIECSGPRTAS